VNAISTPVKESVATAARPAQPRWTGPINAAIAGVGSYIPEVVVTNADLERTMDTTDEWIRTKIGIRERRIVRPDQAMSDLAIAAARQALERAGVDPLDLELIIVAGSNHDYLMPATACLVQAALGARNAGAMDIRNACSGFNYALAAGSSMLVANRMRAVLVIGAEVHSKIIDWKDRTMAPFFGDGGGAVVLKPARPGVGVLSNYLGAWGHEGDAIIVPGGGSRQPFDEQVLRQSLHMCRMDGKRVKQFVQSIFVPAIEQACARAGVTIRDLDFVISHQANLRLIEAGVAELGMTMEQTHTIIEPRWQR